MYLLSALQLCNRNFVQEWGKNDHEVEEEDGEDGR